MKDDYLWNKTGEPDPEIQHLERVLGQLRHKRRAQDLPALEIMPRTKPRLSYRLLAIAASLIFAALALGAFLTLQRQSKNGETNKVAMVNIELPPPNVVTGDAPVKAVETTQPQSANPATVKVSDVYSQTLAARRRSLSRSSEAESREREQAEGLMAKEQLIKAIGITSSKLNLVQKKIQGDGKLGPSS